MTQKKSKMVKNIPAQGEIVDKEMIPLLFCFKDKKKKEKKAYASLKIAESEEERKVGLSKTERLGPASGMFFTKAGSFWMPPEMRFPLDIVFIDKHGTILEKKAMPLDNGRGRYQSFEPGVEHAVELPLGFCDKHNIVNGDILSLE